MTEKADPVTNLCSDPLQAHSLRTVSRNNQFEAGIIGEKGKELYKTANILLRPQGCDGPENYMFPPLPGVRDKLPGSGKPCDVDPIGYIANPVSR
jgi:hypothetical protein